MTRFEVAGGYLGAKYPDAYYEVEDTLEEARKGAELIAANILEDEGITMIAVSPDRYVSEGGGWFIEVNEFTPADDPQCQNCGVYQSEHVLLGCREGFAY